jgi:hypothetical protein
MDIQTTLNLLFEEGDEDQIFSHVLCRLSPSYFYGRSSTAAILYGPTFITVSRGIVYHFGKLGLIVNNTR